MTKINHNISRKDKIKRRVRAKISGTSQRPRLSINRSNKYLSLQVIDDTLAKTLVGIGDYGKKAVLKGTKTERAEQLAKKLFTQLEKKKIKNLVLDRGCRKYHGRIKTVADVLRQSGIQL